MTPPTPARRASAPEHFEDRLARGAMLAPAGANVVMQLSRRAVGRAVAESPSSSGSLMRHPLRRTRTTLTYIWVALWGDEDERIEMRRGVDAQHRRVRSAPDHEVAYDAFDASLQLWVAACMYVGSIQGYEMLYGPLDDADADRLYARCSRLATTLQVPLSSWPADREAFDAYWTEALTELEVDEVTRRYLADFVALRFLPGAVATLMRPLHRLLVGGFLEPAFRDLLALTWTPRDQRRFEVLRRVIRRGDRLSPGALARFPWNLVRYDARRRLARGRPLV